MGKQKLITLYIWMAGLMLVCGTAGSLWADSDDPQPLKPYSLTQELIDQLVSPGGNWFEEDGAFSLNGMGVGLKRIAGNRIVLDVRVDKRMDLWGGRPNDLASAHGGDMELYINAILDNQDNDIYAPSQENPWDKNVTIYLRDNGIYRGTRTAYVTREIKADDLMEISGTIHLSLPVDWSSFAYETDSALPAVHPLIKDLTVGKYILKLRHPHPVSDVTIHIMAFDGAGRYIAVVGETVPAKGSDSRTFYFPSDSDVKRIEFTIAGGMVRKTIPFTIRPSD